MNSLTLTDAKAFPRVSPVCEPDVGALELWAATDKNKKYNKNTTEWLFLNDRTYNTQFHQATPVAIDREN